MHDGSEGEENKVGLAALERFLEGVPVLHRFRDGVNSNRYMPVPDGWLVGSADVIGSTEAIANGAYKTVNMIGAGVIAATMNATGTRTFPFVFGGDGATFVVPPDFEDSARSALSAMRRWTTDETDLRLRAALVPVANIRREGLDVLLARFAPNDNVSYAMFAGGGLAWAEREMKAGRYEVARASVGVRPDLEGLSCRWRPADAQRGEIISLIVQPHPDASTVAYQTLETSVLDIIHTAGENEGHPITPDNARFSAFPAGLDLELRASTPPGARFARRVGLRAFALFAWTLFKFNIRTGGFDPTLYRDDLRANSDFRKFDDGMKLTVDCALPVIEQLEALLDDAVKQGIAAYGLHRQQRALMTCIVPSNVTRDHIHFVDGADGGYAKAAEMLKKQLQDTQSGRPQAQDRRLFDD